MFCLKIHLMMSSITCERKKDVSCLQVHQNGGWGEGGCSVVTYLATWKITFLKTFDFSTSTGISFFNIWFRDMVFVLFCSEFRFLHKYDRLICCFAACKNVQGKTSPNFNKTIIFISFLSFIGRENSMKQIVLLLRAEKWRKYNKLHVFK